MPSTIQSESTKTTHVAKTPYLNSVPYFHGLTLADRFESSDLVPRASAVGAAAGKVGAALLPAVEYFRQEERFERLGHFGIAVHGRSFSTILFSRRPIRQLENTTIAVSQETSTTVCLLRLVLEQRYRLAPSIYTRTRSEDADAVLLIGDEAIAFQKTNTTYPFEVDVAFEWWLWQHLPCVFAVWAVRRDAPADDKKRLEATLARSLSMNTGRLDEVAKAHEGRAGMDAAEIKEYLANFAYRLGKEEELGLARFRQLLEENGMLEWDPS